MLIPQPRSSPNPVLGSHELTPPGLPFRSSSLHTPHHELQPIRDGETRKQDLVVVLARFGRREGDPLEEEGRVGGEKEGEEGLEGCSGWEDGRRGEEEEGKREAEQVR